MKNKKTSDFGKGFVYNLFLFAKHHQSYKDLLDKQQLSYGSWFNGAGDHFFELEIPKQWKNTKLGRKIAVIQDNILTLRVKDASKKDYEDVFKSLEDICLLIDKKLGIKPIEARWK